MRSGVRTPLGRVTLRDVRSADAVAVHGLLLGVLAEGIGFVATPAEVGDDPSPSQRAVRSIEGGDGVGVVAQLGPHIVGYAFARPSGPARLSHDAHLEIVLAPRVRGQGLGGVLLDALVDRVRQRPDYLRLSLAVFADNAPAVRLYRSRGFVEEGRRRGAVRADDGTLRDDLLMVMWVRAGGPESP